MRLFIIVICLYLSGCAVTSSSPDARSQQALNLSKSSGWKEYTIPTSKFTLKAYGSQKRGSILTVYIEGDGLAWMSEDMPSSNPTPINPVALKMAVRDHHSPVVYLARPCQYVFNKEWQNCKTEYWTNLRFSPEVVEATNQALDFLKKSYHAKKINLIGYSGGGTISALVSARRHDVIKLTTIAAVLDTKQWVEQAGLTPLTGSLNPAEEWQKLISIPQEHWIAGKDTVVPKENILAYVNRFPVGKKPLVKIMPDLDHTSIDMTSGVRCFSYCFQRCRDVL